MSEPFLLKVKGGAVNGACIVALLPSNGVLPRTL
jgi:hypothetical protein